MGRWQPDARGRLQLAALELYGEQGFEQTTVADIAERAGVTERTFFRHFADKREVLFDGASELERRAVEAILVAPPSCPPVEAVGAGMAAAAAPLDEVRDYSRLRAAAIAGHASLQERELLKLAALTAAATAALHERGVPEPAATLAAEVGVAAFKVGFGWWIADDATDTLTACIRSALDQLRALTSQPATRAAADR
ncbi:DNA-binding transcriptional regulator, AcrR family [Friedmanniella luteola]|uniref:DNA-binding transcriptional regulator, AcrR family n=1 Tax=Friedmanniella luteola TaxID=546871 RepID=A0A1H1M4W4_9ACTN|nr:TetR/AcrR family transcriptional regulator [Friedmanniella luteola]SDR81737.1 DNA-binding transcriptional regulator, AcrR family [Friedmanniella luteola]